MLPRGSGDWPVYAATGKPLQLWLATTPLMANPLRGLYASVQSNPPYRALRRALNGAVGGLAEAPRLPKLRRYGAEIGEKRVVDFLQF